MSRRFSTPSLVRVVRGVRFVVFAQKAKHLQHDVIAYLRPRRELIIAADPALQHQLGDCLASLFPHGQLAVSRLQLHLSFRHKAIRAASRLVCRSQQLTT